MLSNCTSLKKKKTALKFLFLSCLMLIVLNYSCINKRTQECNFKRFPFQIGKNHNSTILEFNKKKFSWTKKGDSKEIAYAKMITSGVGLEIKNKAFLRIIPKSAGKKGIHFTFFTYSKKKNLIITVIFRRDKRIINQEIFNKNRTKKIFHTLSKELVLKRNDEIIIKAEGSGILILSDLIIYNIIPKHKRKLLFIIALDNMSFGKIDKKVNNTFLTPALNELKRDSVFFSNAFAQSSWTYPSFMSMFSGLYEHNLDLDKKRFLSSEKPFLVKQLKEKFITVSFNGGAWLQPKFGTSRGFDIVQYIAGTGARFAGKKLFKRTIDFLENNSAPSLMMFLHTYQVHSPFFPDEKFLKKINPKPKYKKLSNYINQNQYLENVDPEVKKSLLELYNAEIMEFDSYLSRFINFLKTEGLYKQSTIVFLSDHGEEFHEHSGWFHGHSLYNELVKIPLMIKFPTGEVSPQINTNNIGLLDLFPTILDFYKIPIPENLNGVSLMSSIHSKTVPRQEIFFSTSCSISKNLPIKIGMIKNQYKIIYNFPYSEKQLDFFKKPNTMPPYIPYEIYNLNKDPLELNNIVSKKEILLKRNKSNFNRIIKIIKKHSSKKRPENIKLDENETKKLKSLGYL